MEELSSVLLARIHRLLKREGGYVNHPADRGGPTKYGITIGTLTKWRGVSSITIADFKDLTKAEAVKIYAKRYYDVPDIDLLPEAMREHAFDMAVNHGPDRAVQIIQSVLTNTCAGPIEVDGIIGPLTIRAAEHALEQLGDALLNDIVDKRIGFYHYIVRKRPSQAVFLKGWLKRAEEFLT